MWYDTLYCLELTTALPYKEYLISFVDKSTALWTMIFPCDNEINQLVTRIVPIELIGKRAGLAELKSVVTMQMPINPAASSNVAKK